MVIQKVNQRLMLKLNYKYRKINQLKETIDTTDTINYFFKQKNQKSVTAFF